MELKEIFFHIGLYGTFALAALGLLVVVSGLIGCFYVRKNTGDVPESKVVK